MKTKKEIFEKAFRIHQNGKIKEAQKLYLKLTKTYKKNYKLFFLLGTTYLQIKQYNQAIDLLIQSINLNSNFPDAFNNKGIALAKQKNYLESIKDYDSAIKLKINYYDAYLNKGIALKNLRKYKEAIKCFETCINLNPKNSLSYYNYGNLCREVNDDSKALELYDKAIKLSKNYIDAYYGRGQLYVHYNKYDLAIKDFEQTLKLDANYDYVQGALIHTKRKINRWDNQDKEIEDIKIGIQNNKKIIHPFNLTSLIDDPQIQKDASTLHSKNFSPTVSTFIDKNKTAEDKIKIGYFSADFNEHVVSRLICKLIGLHDLKKFKIYCYAFGFKEKDNMHKLIESKVDVWRDIRNLTNHDVSLLARKDGIDIAIDLQGYTGKSRVGIFGNRVAPIQINFLGYPGTMGADFMDYIIADKNLIPESSEKFYTEKIIHMPDCYQPQNDELKISDKISDRSTLSLPNNCFVFCAINNSYKITSDVFDVWMKLLSKVKNSVLWLLESNEWSKLNLIKEANLRGINSSRLIFSKKTSYELYMSQFKYADLFLDTFIYNAGATASNALQMGVPIITKKGNSYVSRMAASLLYSIGLSELITTDTASYEKLALELSTNKSKLDFIKEKLNKNKLKKPLFDVEKYTKNFENRLHEVFDNYIEGNKPKNFFL